MADRGAARRSKGKTHRPKKPDVCPPEAEDAERYLGLIKKAETYLEGELERVVQEDGNSAEAIRLRKHFQERLQEARRQASGEGSEAGGAPQPNTRGWLESGVVGEGKEPETGGD